MLERLWLWINRPQVIRAILKFLTSKLAWMLIKITCKLLFCVLCRRYHQVNYPDETFAAHLNSFLRSSFASPLTLWLLIDWFQSQHQAQTSHLRTYRCALHIGFFSYQEIECPQTKKAKRPKYRWEHPYKLESFLGILAGCNFLDKLCS